MKRLNLNNFCTTTNSGNNSDLEFEAYKYHQRIDYLIECLAEGIACEVLESAGASRRDIITAKEIIALRNNPPKEEESYA